MLILHEFIKFLKSNKRLVLHLHIFFVFSQPMFMIIPKKGGMCLGQNVEQKGLYYAVCCTGTFGLFDLCGGSDCGNRCLQPYSPALSAFFPALPSKIALLPVGAFAQIISDIGQTHHKGHKKYTGD